VDKYFRARQYIKGRIGFACWICKATNTVSEYVILTGFSTARIVTRTRHNVTSISALPAFSFMV